MKIFSGDYWHEHLPIRKALLWIFGITLLISGSATGALFYNRHLQDQRMQDPKYAICSIVQTCKSGPRLPNGYLTEVLELAADRPANLFRWNTQEGERLLASSPLLRRSSIQKIAPNMLAIHYSSRIPLARLGELSDTLIDDEGVFLPDAPFLAAKELPTIYLGTSEVAWGEQDSRAEMALSLALLRLIHNSFPDKVLTSLDVSQAYALSVGKRQVVAVFSGEGGPHILRLTADGYRQQLANYKTLLETRQVSAKQGIVIDLRLDHLAYLNPLGEL